MRPIVASLGAAWVVGLAVLLSGCASVVEMPLRPELLAAAGPAPPTVDPARLRLVLADPGQRYRNAPIRARDAQIDLPIGAVVDAAAGIALREQFAAVVAAASPDGAVWRLEITDIAADVQSDLVYVVPVIVFGLWADRVDIRSRLGVRMALRDPDGRVRWERPYDTAYELVEPKRRNMLEFEPVREALQRVLHEQSARLMRDAARDLRTWFDAERRRDRAL